MPSSNDNGTRQIRMHVKTNASGTPELEIVIGDMALSQAPRGRYATPRREVLPSKFTHHGLTVKHANSRVTINVGSADSILVKAALGDALSRICSSLFYSYYGLCKEADHNAPGVKQLAELRYTFTVSLAQIRELRDALRESARRKRDSG